MSNLSFESPCNYFDLDRKHRNRVVYVEEGGETTVRIYNQDHTLTNMLRIPLGKNPDVISSGYTHRRPFEDFVSLVIVTKPTTSAEQVIKDASQRLGRDIEQLHQLVFETLFDD